MKVFILEPNELVRRGVRLVLEETEMFEIVGEAGSAITGTDRILCRQPDVVVLSTRLAEPGSVALCRDIRARSPRTGVLVLSPREDDDALFNAIYAGASGYLLESVSGVQLVDAVTRIASGQSLLDPALTMRVLDRIRYGDLPAQQLRGLSGRESEVLGYIAEGLTNRQIASQMHLAEKTVKTYVSSMLAKLGLQSRIQAAVLATQLETPASA